MAVGYHKINSSAARSKKRSAKMIDCSPRQSVVIAGSRVRSAMYGFGAVMDEFVSDCDKSIVLFDSSAMVEFSGGAIRSMIHDFESSI